MASKFGLDSILGWKQIANIEAAAKDDPEVDVIEGKFYLGQHVAYDPMKVADWLARRFPERQSYKHPMPRGAAPHSRKRGGEDA